MQFSSLVSGLPLLARGGDAQITGITHSSSEVRPGYVFVAIRGAKADGHDFISQALALGAGAVIINRPMELPDHVAYAMVEDSRLALAEVSALLYGQPSRKMRMVGITGTNGKTTTAFLVRSILKEAGFGVGLMGTVQVEVGDTILPVKFTTPEPPQLQSLLRLMVDHALSHAVMEVSSHAIALSRVAKVEYDTAVFTNLTQDHLDLHGTMENYFLTKARLFTGLNMDATKPNKIAIVNIDDAYGRRLVGMSGGRVMTYSIDQQADITATDIRSGADGSVFVLTSPFGSTEVAIATPGRHSIYNALGAAGAALSEGASLEAVVRGLKLPGIPGRMQPVNEGQKFSVFIDYAHTPDGLENVLRAAKGFAGGKVIVVFGCGGDRDRGKRPLMGAIAARLADIAYLTSDNPRSEDPLRIIEDVLPGFYGTNAASRVVVEPDRRSAIAKAIAIAEEGDVVLITGKGHENYQIFREGTVHFDDREEARAALRGRV